MNLRQYFSQSPVVRVLSSVRVTVVCLLLLYFLTLVGTVAQIQEGLYLAQRRYFESFFFLAFGFLPFPGAQAVMWVLFFNLLCAAAKHFVYRWQRIGIIIIHAGLLLFLVSGYMTLHTARESHLTLSEGQASNTSVAYHDWEVAIWEDTPPVDNLTTSRDVISLDTRYFRRGQEMDLKELGVRWIVTEYHHNCEAYKGQGSNTIRNASGLVRFAAAPLFKEPEKNTPGGIFRITSGDSAGIDVLLYGGENIPTPVTIGFKTYNMMLRLKHFPLPFMVRLKEFKKEEHPGTQTPRSFQSLVEIEVNKAWREKLISMNEPLRYNDFTFYQASYAVDRMGLESSTLAVVKNAGRLMPYISTFVTFMGLVVHFGTAALRPRKNSTEKTNHA